MPTIKISLKTLRSIIKEVAEENLTESEIYVDEEGYAHDDEGNPPVKTSLKPGLYKASQISHMLGGTTKTSQPKKFRPNTVPMAQQNAVNVLTKHNPSSKFFASLSTQVRSGKWLSDKQKEIVIKSLQSIPGQEELVQDLKGRSWGQFM